MNSRKTPRQPEDERIAGQMPDPTGPPRSVPKGDPVLNLIATLGVGLVAVGGVMFASFATTTRTCGATRSAKLQWEQRKLQIEQAYQQDQAYREQAIEGFGDEASADDGERQ